MGTGLEGLNGRPYRTERQAMVPKAWHLAQRRGYGFIKAPPFSGKTAFVQQVLNCAEAQGWRAFYFNCTELKELSLELDEALKVTCGGALAELMREGESCIACRDARMVACFLRPLRRLACMHNHLVHSPTFVMCSCGW